MRNLLFENVLDVTKYNEFDLITAQTIEKEIITPEVTFANMQEQVIYNITEDGTYTINSDSNKNIKLNIASGINVEINEFTKANDTIATNIEIDVASDAKVYYLVIDRLVKAHNKRFVEVAKNAHVDFHVIGFNKDANENEFVMNLNEEGAVGNFKLITVATEKSNNIYRVDVNNMAPRTSGDIWEKAVAKSQGQNAFLATGYIHNDCDGASNYQESRVLLLDEASKGDASPLLLINHHDVVAGHAAGVSRVNEEELYYLQTRGITKNEAERLMTLAFVKPLIDEMRSEELQEEILIELNKLLEG